MHSNLHIFYGSNLCIFVRSVVVVAGYGAQVEKQKEKFS